MWMYFATESSFLDISDFPNMQKIRLFMYFHVTTFQFLFSKLQEDLL